MNERRENGALITRSKDEESTVDVSSLPSHGKTLHSNADLNPTNKTKNTSQLSGSKVSTLEVLQHASSITLVFNFVH